ncbi:uncharacterized protein [Prorops nasuta]|uniref:uncharacterized protein n=1 Tax=Prorops nasuta TaxID=863751 RepID=UPI0034CDA948
MTFSIGCLYIIINFLIILYSTCGDTLLKRNEKRLDNFPICLESFDVHKDKIIRTQDSRELGAKFLNHIDVESRRDCLKFCCETDGCDVFIYEEKKHGSCYLFQCGPLYDFKCKFTDHANYSSAVRTNYDNVKIPAQAMKDVEITLPEHQLKSLRKVVDSVPQEYAYTELPVKLAEIQTLKPVVTTPMVMRPSCSQNQYKCRSTGECIAIYNVCDGIPQCVDGSDEAADLVCPTEKPTPLSQLLLQQRPLPPSLSADLIKYQQMLNSRGAYLSEMENNLKPWEMPSLIHPGYSQQPNLQPNLPLMEMNQQHKFPLQNYQRDFLPYDQNTKEKLFDALRALYEQNNPNVYEQEPPRIFNHKEPGVIREPEGVRSNGVYIDPISHVLQPLAPNSEVQHAGTVQVSPPISDIQHKKIENVNVQLTTSSPHDADTSTKKKDLHEVNQKLSTQSGKVNNQMTITTEKHTIVSQHSQDAKDKGEKSKTIETNHVKNTTKASLVTIQHLKQTHEEEMLKPRGAVISLALGLIATAITAALIACRLRVVRRRGRRGRGSYAHDADYLVNGMYL